VAERLSRCVRAGDPVVAGGAGGDGHTVARLAGDEFTVLLEGLWPKKRILAVYLNLVDWGDGIFGAEAAANAYFGTDAGSLDSAQAARLAAILPNPHKWKAAHPGRYVRRRTGLLESRSAMVTRDGLNFCVR